LLFSDRCALFSFLIFDFVPAKEALGGQLTAGLQSLVASLSSSENWLSLDSSLTLQMTKFKGVFGW
jgi:hypothetical protein